MCVQTAHTVLVFHHHQQQHSRPSAAPQLGRAQSARVGVICNNIFILLSDYRTSWRGVAWRVRACVCACSQRLLLFCFHLSLDVVIDARPGRCEEREGASATSRLGGPRHHTAPHTCILRQHVDTMFALIIHIYVGPD